MVQSFLSSLMVAYLSGHMSAMPASLSSGRRQTSSSSVLCLLRAHCSFLTCWIVAVETSSHRTSSCKMASLDPEASFTWWTLRECRQLQPRGAACPLQAPSSVFMDTWLQSSSRGLHPTRPICAALAAPSCTSSQVCSAPF